MKTIEEIRKAAAETLDAWTRLPQFTGILIVRAGEWIDQSTFRHRMCSRHDLLAPIELALTEPGRLTVKPLFSRPMAMALSMWTEDVGDCLWWRFPVEEPPYVGSPLDTDWPGYHTHWTRIHVPEAP